MIVFPRAFVKPGLYIDCRKLYKYTVGGGFVQTVKQVAGGVDRGDQMRLRAKTAPAGRGGRGRGRGRGRGAAVVQEYTNAEWEEWLAWDADEAAWWGVGGRAEGQEGEEARRVSVASPS